MAASNPGGRLDADVEQQLQNEVSRSHPVSRFFLEKKPNIDPHSDGLLSFGKTT